MQKVSSIQMEKPLSQGKLVKVTCTIVHSKATPSNAAGPYASQKRTIVWHMCVYHAAVRVGNAKWEAVQRPLEHASLWL